MMALTDPFARFLGRPVRRFSALDAFRLQQALPLPGFEPVPPRGPGRPSKATASTAPAHGKRSAGAGAGRAGASSGVGLSLAFPDGNHGDNKHGRTSTLSSLEL